MNKEAYLTQLRAQAKRLYVQIKAGYPVSDQDKYRTEGFINAAITLGVIDSDEAMAVMEEVHQSVLGVSIADRKARETKDWNEPMDYGNYDSPSFTRQ